MTDGDLATPAHADVQDRIDGERVASGLASVIEQQDPDLLQELLDDRLSWSLEGFDTLGVATVHVTRKATGELVAQVQVHWSVIVRPDR